MQGVGGRLPHLLCTRPCLGTQYCNTEHAQAAEPVDKDGWMNGATSALNAILGHPGSHTAWLISLHAL